jgi:hypothetical protein
LKVTWVKAYDRVDVNHQVCSAGPKCDRAIANTAPASAYEQKGEHEVSHLYQHEADAERCTAVYAQRMGVPAFLVTITPPLAIIRRADAWGVLDWSSRQLYLYASREEAALAVEPGRQLIATPIRQGMPTNQGTPQFGQVQS